MQALLPERERYLHQHALNKVRVITRSMKSAEKEAYLGSEAFQGTLRQIRRRDRILQGLLRGELVLSGILDEIYPEVAAAYKARGFREESSRLVGEWRTGRFRLVEGV